MARTSPGRRGGREGDVRWGRALVLIAVLVVAGIVILSTTSSSPKGHSAAAAHPTTTTTTTAVAPTTTVPVLPPTQVKVLVLNGANPTQPLAGEWTAKLKARGYVTEPPNNATITVPASEIYVVTPGYEAEAQELAAAVGDPTITVKTSFDPSAPVPAADRETANLILVVGPDLAATA
jgi:hypothetical protein